MQAEAQSRRHEPGHSAAQPAKRRAGARIIKKPDRLDPCAVSVPQQAPKRKAGVLGEPAASVHAPQLSREGAVQTAAAETAPGAWPAEPEDGQPPARVIAASQV